MHAPSTLPGLLADEGARRLALAHLLDAAAARSRVLGSADPEALHDYRVALRRLRSCLRAYRRCLRSTVTRRSLRRLRRLARGTSRSRDLEVHLAWLGEQRDRLGEAERPGVSWLIKRLTEARHRAWDEMARLDQRLFPRLHERLTRQVSAFRTTVRLDAGLGPRSTAAVTASRTRQTSERLRERLLRVADYSSMSAIHRARIAAKHLRYLLEPFAESVPEGRAAVEQLKALQSSFGDVHDAHVFLVELRKTLPEAREARFECAGVLPGVEAAAAALQTRGMQAFEGAAGAWLGGAAEPFFRTVDSIADAIAALGDRDREIERKFLLTGLPPLEGARGPLEMEQGYLPGERLVERLRRVRSDDGVELVRTLKEGSGLIRLEIEEAVTPEVFDRLWPLTEGRRLRKRRYRVADEDLTWEIDEFLDRDLLLAEVEIPPGLLADVEVPGWLLPYVEREVTEDSEYSNFRLATSPTGAGATHPEVSEAAATTGGTEAAATEGMRAARV
jgi:CHAD domain-containing protein/CYTH domain-containing protein